MALLPKALTDPDIRRHLLRDEGEVVVDEVRKHWVVYLVPALILLGSLCFLWLAAKAPMDVAIVPLVISGLLALVGFWKAISASVDRFVITNMRVFRVHGVLVRSHATMPLGRILDITVIKPVSGRLFGYGHFIFESAAQAQGLREIRFVGRPDERDLAIQRVVQRSGLRGPKVVN